MSNRLPLISQPIADFVHSEVVTVDHITLPEQDSLPTEAFVWPHSQADTAIPPWQRDTGFCSSKTTTGRSERNDTIKSLMQLGRVGIIIDSSHRVQEGTSGWVAHLSLLPSLSLHNGCICAVTASSQSDFAAAVKRLTAAQACPPLSILLRDLDGWGADLLQIAQVGRANPDSAVLILPRSLQDVGKVVAGLAKSVDLSKRDVAIATMVLQGRIDIEIASKLRLEISPTRKAITSILRKFGVRRRSDFVRLFSRLP